MRQNPRRLRPTLRKKKGAGAAKQEQFVKKEPQERRVLLQSTEVWEVESDSDIEFVAAMAAPSADPATSNTSPKACHGCCKHCRYMCACKVAWSPCRRQLMMSANIGGRSTMTLGLLELFFRHGCMPVVLCHRFE